MKPNLNCTEGVDSTLKKFLLSRRDAELKGPPPTSTSLGLMTLLDDTKEQKKQKSKIGQTSQQLATVKVNFDQTYNSKRLISKVTIPSVNGGLWSKVDVTGNILPEPQGLHLRGSSTNSNAFAVAKRALCSDSALADCVGPADGKWSDRNNSNYNSNKPLSNMDRRKRNLDTVVQGVWSETASSSTFLHHKSERSTLDAIPFQGSVKSVDTSKGATGNEFKHNYPKAGSVSKHNLLISNDSTKPSTVITTGLNIPDKKVNEVITETLLDHSSGGNRATLNEGNEKSDLNTAKRHPKDDSLIKTQKDARITNRDNFVRLNLRNRAGACRGAKGLKKHNRLKRRRIEESQNRQSSMSYSNPISSDPDKTNDSRDDELFRRRNISLHTVIDPIDDFLDGTFHKAPNPSLECAPVCTRHNLPCKLLTVKKASGGNKGRKFYVCSLPQYEGCSFFQWEDDTVQAAQKAIMTESKDPSGFVERQISAYDKRWKILSVPELRSEAKKRRLSTSGDKKSLVKRLVDWAANELKQKLKQDPSSSLLNVSAVGNLHSDEESSSSCKDEEDDTSSATEELEFTTSDTSADMSPLFEDKAIEIITNQNEGVSLRSRLKELFGFSEFREGQEWAIQRCLQNKRSLFVAPTGLGKSICYALPAAIVDGVCIVVSPLISLMEDQLRRLHPSITALSFSGNLSSAQMALAVDDLVRNRLKIIFISPERLLSPAFRRLLRPKLNSVTNINERQLPTVSLLCIDEAHCLSQWGHNFRPSYLRLQYLVKSLEPRSILALTATAGPPVIRDICQALDINRNDNCSGDDGVMVVKADRNNIDISVHFVTDETERMNLLTVMLRVSQGTLSKKHRHNNSKIVGCLSVGSIIIYVWRKKDAEYISEQLRGYEDLGKVVCYHAGMTASDRASSQNMFMRGKARICVATVAFGMGIDKADVSGVVHMCLPSSPENFMQEIGRAGRSGQRAKAVAIIMPNDFILKHSLSYSECLSYSQIRSLLQIVQNVVDEANAEICSSTLMSSPEYHLDVALPLTAVVEAIDCKDETIMTLLSYMESESLVFSKSLLSMQGLNPDRATVVLKKNKIDKLALHEPIMQCIRQCGVRADRSLTDPIMKDRSLNNDFEMSSGTAIELGFAAYGLGTYHFSIMTCARVMGPDIEPRHIHAALRRLEKSGEIELKFYSKEKQSLHLTISSDGLRFFCESRTERETMLEDISKSLWRIFSTHDKNRTSKVESIYEMMIRLDEDYKQMNKVTSCASPHSDGETSSTTRLFHQMMSDYFNQEQAAPKMSLETLQSPLLQFTKDDSYKLSQLSSDALSLLSNPSLRNSSSSGFCVKFGEKYFEDYTAILITKILHGIESPRLAISEWFSHPLWAKYRLYSFESLLATINALLEDSMKV